jgi:mRNA interferase RelE/StbE
VKRKVVLCSKAQADLAALDRSVALRIVNAIYRFGESGAGNIKALHGTHPPEFRLRVGDWRVCFYDHADSIEILRVQHRSGAYR